MKPVMERLIARIDVGLCWDYTGSVTADGYGVIGLGAREDGIGYTRRVVFEHLVGPIPAGVLLSPWCRNRRCCDPDHMELITRRISMSRMRQRQRT